MNIYRKINWCDQVWAADSLLAKYFQQEMFPQGNLTSYPRHWLLHKENLPRPVFPWWWQSRLNCFVRNLRFLMIKFIALQICSSEFSKRNHLYGFKGSGMYNQQMYLGDNICWLYITSQQYFHNANVTFRMKPFQFILQKYQNVSMTQ